MKYILVFIFCGILSRAFGQRIYDSSFIQGLQFTVQHEENSNTFIRFDESVLDLSYKASIEKVYTLLSSQNGVYKFSVSTARFVDTVESEGRQTVYQSDRLSPQSSGFEHSIDSLLKNPDQLTVNGEGIVSKQDVQANPVSEFMGLYSGMEKDNTLFILLPGLALDSSIEEGKTWSLQEADAIGRKITTSYRLVSKNKFYYAVEYERTVTSENENANENGVMVIDAANGFLEELNSKSISNTKILFNGKPCLVEKWSDKIQRFTFFND